MIRNRLRFVKLNFVVTEVNAGDQQTVSILRHLFVFLMSDVIQSCFAGIV